jgi:hypothetical protein
MDVVHLQPVTARPVLFALEGPSQADAEYHRRRRLESLRYASEDVSIGRHVVRAV